MNARQKAKYYKRKYMELAKMSISRAIVTTHRIDTLRVERYYPEALVMDKSFVERALVRDIAITMSESLGKYMTYRTEFVPHLNSYEFIGELKVVRKN